MASSVSFSGPGGADPVTHHLRILSAALPTVGDGLWAGMFLRSRIRERTARGVDSQGVPFPAYSKGYARVKARRLGHANVVDLFGFGQHPHMLNAFQVASGFSGPLDAQSAPSAVDQPQPGEAFEIGMWDEGPAFLADIHNKGRGKVPRRHFLDNSDEDLLLMEQGIAERMDLRMAALPA